MDINELAKAGSEPVNTDGLAITPDDGGQTPEPIPEPEPTPELEPTPEPEPEPGEHEDPMPQTGDKIDIQAWIGRRDVARETKLRNEFDEKLNQLVGLVTPFIQQAQQQPQGQPIQSQLNINPEEIDFINDPQGSFNKMAQAFTNDYIPKYNQQVTQQQTQKATQIMQGIEFLAKNDPLAKDESDKIIEIAKKVQLPSNFATLDAQTASKMIFTEAQNINLREKVQKKINPLAGNRPVKQPIGSVTPSIPVRPVAAQPVLSNEILEVAAKMGLTPKEAMEYLKE